MLNWHHATLVNHIYHEVPYERIKTQLNAGGCLPWMPGALTWNQSPLETCTLTPGSWRHCSKCVIFCATRSPSLGNLFRQNLHFCSSVLLLLVVQKRCTRKEGPTEGKWMRFCVAPVDCQFCNSTIIKGSSFSAQKGSSSFCAFESDVSVCVRVSVTCSLQAAAQ